MDRQPRNSQGHTVMLVRESKVLAFRTDAAFFYERGVRYLERNDLERALKAFRKTVEVEPQNPINHCNLAGVLSELGDFEASNEVLLRILNEIDPSMSECRFYLANNYANMGEYGTAEEYVLSYLDSEPDGEYVEDAEEMLNVLMDEFGGGEAFKAWEEKRKEEEQAAAKKDGRHLLEEGHFEAAVEWLEGVIGKDPSNLAAHNNLSLAYYYTGQYDEAVETAHKVLANSPHNIHALCNLAVFRAQLGPKDELHRLVRQLLKVFPLHYDQAMKVGTTLGLIGEHRGAYSVFEKLARVVEGPESALLHSLAASAANLGNYASAKRWWRMLSEIPDMSEVAKYYLKQIDDAIADKKPTLRIGYQYDYPLHVQFAKMKERLDEGDVSLWKSDPLLRASLYWGLRHGNAETKKAVIRTLALIGDGDADKALRLFLKRHDIDEPMQATVLCALQKMGARGRVEFFTNGEIISMRISEIPKDVILKVDPAYEAVWAQTEQNLRALRHIKLIKDAKKCWLGFLRFAFLRSDIRIVKPNVWSAALAYLVLQESHDAMRQKDVAEIFGVSPSAVSKTATRLSRFMPSVQGAK